MDYVRLNNPIKKLRKHLNMLNEDEIVDWPSIGDDQTHRSEPKAI